MRAGVLPRLLGAPKRREEVQEPTSPCGSDEPSPAGAPRSQPGCLGIPLP